MVTSERKIVGIVLVRNEDIFVERALRNIADFCDQIIVADNYSRDRTWKIANALSREIGSIECHRIRKTGESHELIKNYAGTNTWIFGVDGDEIYDPLGLREFRNEILAGQYNEWWAVFGNVLNCTSLDEQSTSAVGYLAPPGRSMTKFYNFSLITKWDGPCLERLHGGKLMFRGGYDESRRFDLYKRVSWEEAKFRCLHVSFLKRSSRDKKSGFDRMNIVEMHERGSLERLGFGFLTAWRERKKPNWAQEKYMRGERVTKDVSPFFRKWKMS